MSLRSLQILKRTAVLSLQRFGVDRALGNSRWRRQRLLILGYHGISLDDEHQWDGALYMSPAMLEGRLQLLRTTGCSVLPLTEALKRLYDGTLDEQSVAITFDDGYLDFVTQAHPLLVAYGFPATVYLRTDILDRRAPDIGISCSYLFWKARRTQVRIPELRSEPFPIATREDRAKTVLAIREGACRLRYAPGDEGPLVRSIARNLSLDADAVFARRQLELMSDEDVRRLSKSGVDFQLHTHTHNTPRDRQRFAQEIEINRRRIEGLTGQATPHFCYPSGQYDPMFVPWLAELGVRSATTCDPGLASRSTPPLMLPRFLDTSSTTPELFQSWLTGTAAWLSRRRSYAQRPA